MRQLVLLLLSVYSGWAAHAQTADRNALPETQTLLFHLQHTLAGEGVLLGHQNDLVSGIKDSTEVYNAQNSWSEQILHINSAENVRVYNSDIFRMCGDYAAVHGFDLGRMELFPHTVNIDWHSFSFMQRAMIDAYGRKGISTLTWHMFNPLTYEVIQSVEYTDSIVHATYTEYTDSVVHRTQHHYGPWIENPVAHSPFPDVLTEGTQANDSLHAFLKRAGTYLKSLTTRDTIPVPTPDNPAAVWVRDVTVPVIFRPFHELNGGGFWWGTNSCTDEEYIALWRYVFHYLTDTLEVHNLLFCWSPYGQTSEARYLRRYPGDAYVDILGFEYNNKGMDFYYDNAFNTTVDVVYHVAQAKNKPFALCENGIYQPTLQNAGNTYFTDYFNWIYNDNEARFLSYILFWRNYGNEFKVPYPGHELADDFANMHSSAHLAKFENDLKDLVFNHALGPYMLHPQDFPTRYGVGDKKQIQVTYQKPELLVKVPGEGPFRINVFTLAGKKVFSQISSGNSWRTSLLLSPQIYIVQVHKGDEAFVQKISVR